MKLYTKPGACSTAIHIDLCWTGQPFELQILDADGLKSPEFRALNPAGSVPVLVDGDFVLTQNVAIAGYLADRFPESGLAGDGSARQRAEATRWLAFVNSDLHPAFKPMFAPAAFVADPMQHEALRSNARARIRTLLEGADKVLASRDWLGGGRPLKSRSCPLPQLCRPLLLYGSALGHAYRRGPVRAGRAGRLPRAHGRRPGRAARAPGRRPGLSPATAPRRQYPGGPQPWSWRSQNVANSSPRALARAWRSSGRTSRSPAASVQRSIFSCMK
ncbi:glutathione S-transferase [Pseudoxanthomonas taiwanensis J19]|uniref:Glutathione S-transferase n=1 Tax=Pseudoxanthomonas taiwanensis J19 TaxID=935569 RepID=A0A562DYQ2_9GAMM|nr:glutathione S-transferase [Pseudoxanthomonas taiwanensis J19]